MSKGTIQNACYLVLTASAAILALNTLKGPRRAQHAERSNPVPAFAEGAILPNVMLLTGAADTVPAAAPHERTLLVLFSTSCAYCLASLPTYRRVASTRCDLAMTFVMLNIPASQITRWWSENAWEMDASGLCAKITVGTPSTSLASFGRIATPTHYLLDESGHVVTSQAGALYDIPAWLAVEPPADG